jgi:putative zinc finger/helix-turn-helix YgiT family protein
MSTRNFSQKCGHCRQRAVAIATVPYSIQIDHDGRKYQVNIAALAVPKCGNCGTIVLDEEATTAIDAAFRREAGLLTPEQIRAGREKLGLNQQEFAEKLAIAVSTLSRWETGAQIQQRSLNRLMTAFFMCPEMRSCYDIVQGAESSGMSKFI